jgi:uncharacterized membrane protein
VSKASEAGSGRAVVLVASAVAVATLVPVALHQLGVLEHLPDPPGGVFDSDGITESAMAHPLGVPDALPGMANFAVTVGLAWAAGQREWARKALGGKLLLDGGAAAFNATRQVVRFGKICSWCMGTAVATAVAVCGGRRFVAELFGSGR